MVNFEEHFWSEKYNGFDVLQQNFKLGLNTGKEFAEFLKERSSIEETYSKSLLKLANKCASANLHVGTFEPCWKFLQTSTEKLANVHNQVIQNLNDVSKSVREYGEIQKEKQKQMKDDFAATTEAVLNLQNLSAALIKAKELYQQRSQEVEKCRKDLTNLKDIKNAELKFKKSTDDYKQLVDKRETARKDYCVKMTEISQKLQTVEEQHLTQMLEILSKYGETIKVERFLLDQIIEEFGRNMVALTVENLLQIFINLKSTGKEYPVVVDFEETTLQSKPVDLDAIAVQLKEDKKKRKTEKREKKAERKKKKEKAAANGTGETGNEDNGEKQSELQLDAEGYVIRPADTESVHSGKYSKDSFSSDSDSEDSDDERQKIKVRIKPVDETIKDSSTLSQEELKKLSATLTLMSPSSMHQKMPQLEDKKFTYGWGSDGSLNTSLNKQAYKSKSNIDLLNLDQHSDTASIHSLPVNSTFPALDSTSELPETGLPDKPFGESSTSSPLGSPPNGPNLSGGSGSLSPSASFDKSVNNEKSSPDESDAKDVPPPLPVKSRTLPPRSLPNYNTNEDIDSNGNSFIDLSAVSSANISNKSEEVKELVSTTIDSDIFNNDSFSKVELSKVELLKPLPPEKGKEVAEKKLSLPARTIADKLPPPSTNVKAFPSLEALKPPPLEKRHTISAPSMLQVGGSSRALPANIVAVPRPKPGQLSNPLSRKASSTLPMSSSSSSSTLPVSTSSQSIFSDLLDINFSTTAASTTTSLTKDTENDFSAAWIMPEKSSDVNVHSTTVPASSTPHVLFEPVPSKPAASIPTASKPNFNVIVVSSENVSVVDVPTANVPSVDTSSEIVPEADVSSANDVTSPELNTVENLSTSHSTSPWVNPEESIKANVVKKLTQELLSDQDSNPPIVPRRSAFQVPSPSNVTAGAVNHSSVDRVIPIAVAFIETINGVFKGTDDKSCIVRVTGDMTISFPANIISMLSNNPEPPALTFLVSGTTSLEQIFPNKALVERGGQLPGGEGMLFKFNMAALGSYLKKQAEQETKASYYNIDILKYQVRCYGLSSAPLQLLSYWRCDPEQTDLKIDYTYNSNCMSSPVALHNVSVVVPVDGGVEVMQSKPQAVWSSEHQRCMWKLSSISSTSDGPGANALRARFDIIRGPTTPVPIAVQFTGEGSTISSLNFDLTSPAYKLSLVKKRFATAKYMVEAS